MMKLPVHPLAAGLLGFVILVGGGIVFGLILRPWANANTSAYTKLNLAAHPPADYSRTAPALVWKTDGIETAWTPRNTDVDPGKAFYVAYGCASCHGLDANGSVGGSIAGKGADVLQVFVRNGPGGMPAYSSTTLPEDHLQTIAAWVSSQPIIPD